MAAEPVVVHVSSPLSWRGGEQQLVYLAGELAARGVRQAVVSPPGSAVERICRERGHAHVAVRRRGAIDPLFARGVARAAEALGATLVHAHDPHAHTAAVLAASLFGARARVVVHRRVDLPLQGGRFTRWKYDHPSVGRIVCVSGAIAEVVRGAISRPERLRVVHSGVDPARFAAGADGRLRREYRVPAGVALVGNVAALAAHKGHPVFVDVAALLVRGGAAARFFLVGDGEERAAIERHVAAREVGDAVVLTGFRADVARVLPELDVLLFPSETEGLGTTILDAWAAGVPVVATAVGGIPELVAHGETGLLAPRGDAAALAGYVTTVLRDPALRARLVEGGRRRLAEFTVSRTAERILGIYRDLLAETSSAT